MKVLRFHEGGEVGEFSDLDASGWTPASPHLVWVDFEGPDDDLDLLRERFDFHPLAIEDCLTPEHQPKVESFGSYLFLIARGIDFNPPVEEFQTLKLAAFMASNYLVTYHRRPMRSVSRVWERTVSGARGDRPAADRILVQILDQMIEYYFPALESIDEELEDLEEAIFDPDPGPELLDRLLSSKRRAVEIRRTMAPHREVFSRVARGEFTSVDPSSLAFWRDLHDSAYRLTEEADTIRDLLGGTLEAHLSVTSHRLNEVMKVLTIFATIMLPLTFIVGVYGMNFAHMPELGWRYGYAAVWVVMILVAAGLLWFFRRRSWL